MPIQTYIQDEKGLKELCKALAEEPVVGLDMEFLTGKSYYDRLEILQLSGRDFETIVDCQKVTNNHAQPRNLARLWEELLRPNLTIVIHACYGDMKIFQEHSGRLPRNVFDTQVAWSLLSPRKSIGYNDLVRKVVGAQLDKGEQRSDWSKRPLSNDQKRYALADVEHLLELYEVLYNDLEERNRLSWMKEAMTETLAAIKPRDPEELWRSVRGASKLSPQRQTVLRELAKWRDKAASERNRPASKMLRDDILLAIARRAPRNMHELKNADRFLTAGDIRAWGDDMLRAIKAAEGKRPPEPEERESKPQGDAPKPLLDLMKAYVSSVARQRDFTPDRIVKSAEIEAIATDPNWAEKNELPIVTGWRRELLGEDLLAIARGEMALSWNPKDEQLHRASI